MRMYVCFQSLDVPPKLQYIRGYIFPASLYYNSENMRKNLLKSSLLNFLSGFYAPYVLLTTIIYVYVYTSLVNFLLLLNYMYIYFSTGFECLLLFVCQLAYFNTLDKHSITFCFVPWFP